MADELIDALNAADTIASRTRAREAEYVAPHPALDALDNADSHGHSPNT